MSAGDVQSLHLSHRFVTEACQPGLALPVQGPAQLVIEEMLQAHGPVALVEEMFNILEFAFERMRPFRQQQSDNRAVCLVVSRCHIRLSACRSAI